MWSFRYVSLGQYARQFTPKHTEHPSCEAVLLPQSLSCGRLRAHTQAEQARYKAVPKPKLVSFGFSQCKMEDNLGKREEQKRMWFQTSTSQKREAAMKRTEQYKEHALCHSWKMLSILKIGTKKNGLTHWDSGRGLDDEPRILLYGLSSRPDHDCICYCNLRLDQNASLVSHQSSSDAIIL